MFGSIYHLTNIAYTFSPLRALKLSELIISHRNQYLFFISDHVAVNY